MPYKPPTLYKPALIKAVAREMGYCIPDIQAIIDRMMEIMLDRLAQGDDISFRDFGIFKLKTYNSPVRAYAHYVKGPDKWIDRLPVPKVKFSPSILMEERVAPLVWNRKHMKNLKFLGESRIKQRPKKRKKICNTAKLPSISEAISLIASAKKSQSQKSPS
jgi:nucleoid DNA-binding protein